MPGGYPTAKEVEWVVTELKKRNLTDTVAQYFLHDDDAAASGETRQHQTVPGTFPCPSQFTILS